MWRQELKLVGSDYGLAHNPCVLSSPESVSLYFYVPRCSENRSHPSPHCLPAVPVSLSSTVRRNLLQVCRSREGSFGVFFPWRYVTHKGSSPGVSLTCWFPRSPPQPHSFGELGSIPSNAQDHSGSAGGGGTIWSVERLNQSWRL